jgi:hypothetical protein
MAIMKIGRALFIAYSIVSCVLLAPVNVVRADLAATTSSVMQRIEPSEAAKARIIWRKAAAYCTSTTRRRTSTGQRNL